MVRDVTYSMVPDCISKLAFCKRFDGCRYTTLTTAIIRFLICNAWVDCSEMFPGTSYACPDMRTREDRPVGINGRQTAAAR